jgi:FlaA1/EpsC-like NDP-sugar epimerase
MMKLSARRFARILLDSISWFLAILLSGLLRFDGVLPPGMPSQIFQLCWLAIILSVFVGSLFSLYNGRYRNASLEEVIALSLSVAVIVTILFSSRVLLGFTTTPRSLPIASGALAIVFQLVGRVLINPRILLPFQKNSVGSRTLIYGAGIAGRQLIEQMLYLKNQYFPVAFLDDDKSKSNLRIYGRKVLGSIDSLENVVASENIELLIVAIADVDSVLLRDLESRCRRLNLTLRIIPSAYEVISGSLRLGDLSDISEEDLLGRRPLKANNFEISKFMEGKSILVTGAGGSIGSEIVRQLNRYSPKSVSMLDRDETALLNLQLSLDGTGLLTNSNLILGDVRDRARMEEILEEIRPDIVFHAAALKHLTTLERFPQEAFKTNVLGTLNVLEASEKFDVKVFVNISTDKAANPTCVLGKSKLMTERLTATAQGSDKRYLSVRFGNVIGSNGSFIHTFRKQIEKGGPVTVTHPDVTRFFMTITEAVQLVLHSSIIGRNGETLILDMGQAVHINTIAQHMIDVSGRNIEIKYTGLREGEKLHEVLMAPSEEIEIREHEFIMHTRVDPITNRSDLSWN